MKAHTVMDFIYMSASDDGFMMALDEQGRIRNYDVNTVPHEGEWRIEIQLLY